MAPRRNSTDKSWECEYVCTSIVYICMYRSPILNKQVFIYIFWVLSNWWFKFLLNRWKLYKNLQMMKITSNWSERKDHFMIPNFTESCDSCECRLDFWIPCIYISQTCVTRFRNFVAILAYLIIDSLSISSYYWLTL